MVEIRQFDARLEGVGRRLRVGLPVRLGGCEIERHLRFLRAQAVERSVARRRRDQFRQRRPRL